jgi:hypothetical protein
LRACSPTVSWFSCETAWPSGGLGRRLRESPQPSSGACAIRANSARGLFDVSPCEGASPFLCSPRLETPLTHQQARSSRGRDLEGRVPACTA